MKPTGVAPEGSPARHLLQGVAVAGPAVAPRAQGARLLQVPLQRQAQGAPVFPNKRIKLKSSNNDVRQREL